jgi:hypothetical protein
VLPAGPNTTITATATDCFGARGTKLAAFNPVAVLAPSQDVYLGVLTKVSASISASSSYLTPYRDHTHYASQTMYAAGNISGPVSSDDAARFATVAYGASASLTSAIAANSSRAATLRSAITE